MALNTNFLVIDLMQFSELVPKKLVMSLLERLLHTYSLLVI